MRRGREQQEQYAIRAMYWVLIALFIGIVLAVLVAPARAEGGTRDEGRETRDENAWTAGDTALQVAYSTLHCMDWGQTLRISRDPEHHAEDNGYLGRHPSEGRVNSYFAGTLLAHAAISYVLPKPYRTIWQSFWIGAEYETVRHNRRGGLGISLHW